MSEATEIASMGITTMIELMQARDEIKRLKEELAKQEQGKPVAWLIADGEDLWATNEKNMMLDYPKSQVTPLYTTPPQRTWVGLTPEDKQEYCAQDFGGNRLDAMDWAEAKLKEKNT